MFDHKLITFLTVAKVGSYTKAAEELYISQPAVSQQLKNLEEELNVKLFTYKKRKLHLTQSGKQLLLFVESLRSQSNKFKEHFTCNSEKQTAIAPGSNPIINQLNAARLNFIRKRTAL